MNRLHSYEPVSKAHGKSKVTLAVTSSNLLYDALSPHIGFVIKEDQPLAFSLKPECEPWPFLQKLITAALDGKELLMERHNCNLVYLMLPPTQHNIKMHISALKSAGFKPFSYGVFSTAFEFEEFVAAHVKDNLGPILYDNGYVENFKSHYQIFVKFLQLHNYNLVYLSICLGCVPPKMDSPSSALTEACYMRKID